MNIVAGQTVLLTGASGGLGTYMARAFAELGLNQMLVAYPGVPLEDLKAEVEKKGTRAVSLAADLRDPAQRRLVLDATVREFGKIDILVNNAGVEFTSPYDQLPLESIADILNVNLEAPMMLTRMVLPEMLKRKSGFIVNVSSLAGKSGPAYQEPYAATKAGLIAFTTSLRATYYGSGVSASLICPGFVEAGIYAKLKEKTGVSAPALLGTTRPEKVARAVIRSIQKDVPEIIINARPIRPLLAFNAMFPSAGEWLIRQLGANEFFQHVVDAQARAKERENAPRTAPGDQK